MFRKILTIVIFSVFVVFSIPFFLGLALSHTFFSQNFYTGTFLNTAYVPLVDAAAGNMTELDPAIARYFPQDEIRQLLMMHFTKDVFRTVIEGTSSKLHQEIAATPASISRSDKLPLSINLTPLLEPSKLFLQTATQRVLDRLPPCKAGIQPEITGIFPSCSLLSWKTDDFRNQFNKQFQQTYEKKILNNVMSANGSGFVKNIELDVSRRDIGLVLRQFDMMNIYVVLFMVAFVSLMLLLWLRKLKIGLMYSGIMIVSSGVVGLLIAMMLSKIVLFLPSDALMDPALSEANIALAREILGVVFVSFAKAYAGILLVITLLGGSVYALSRRYLA